MLITRTSEYSGEVRTKDLNITDEQVVAYVNGALLQNAFPHLSKADREFYKTGITDEEWREMSGNPQDNE